MKNGKVHNDAGSHDVSQNSESESFSHEDPPRQRSGSRDYESALISLNTFFEKEPHRPGRRQFGSQIAVLPQIPIAVSTCTSSSHHCAARKGTADEAIQKKPSRNHSKDSCESAPTGTRINNTKKGNHAQHGRHHHHLKSRTTHGAAHHPEERTPVPYHTTNTQPKCTLEKCLSERAATSKTKARLQVDDTWPAGWGEEDSLMFFDTPSFEEDSRRSRSSISSSINNSHNSNRRGERRPIQRILTLDSPRSKSDHLENVNSSKVKTPLRRVKTFDNSQRRTATRLGTDKRNAIKEHSPSPSRSKSPSTKEKTTNRSNKSGSPSPSPSPKARSKIIARAAAGHKTPHSRGRHRIAAGLGRSKRNQDESSPHRSPSPSFAEESRSRSPSPLQTSNRKAQAAGSSTLILALLGEDNTSKKDQRQDISKPKETPLHKNGVDPTKIAAALERAPSINKAIADKIRNNPSLMEMFLVDGSDDNALNEKLSLIPSSHGSKTDNAVEILTKRHLHHHRRTGNHDLPPSRPQNPDPKAKDNNIHHHNMNDDSKRSATSTLVRDHGSVARHNRTETQQLQQQQQHQPQGSKRRGVRNGKHPMTMDSSQYHNDPTQHPHRRSHGPSGTSSPSTGTPRIVHVQ
ncbi:expressed unknown protein [Seminavis robusta]|uniref:Uncharacterized protein n=1 Tax=Seminavis robusta TaxID=568900 RepID=A0A9N8DAK9_9STRA|nr:expressed unknown protein [Seminavis robusta]|eukprot:Sro34_g022030.1 n/a (631) ;mRNA; f:89070-90962